MLTLFILIVLILSFYTGYRRGTAYQLFFTVGYVVSFIVALMFYQGVGERLQLFVPYPSVTSESNMVYYSIEQGFNLDQAFYAGFAFIMILFIGWMATHFLAIFCKNLLYQVLVPRYDGIVAGVVSFILAYCAIFLILKLVSFVPMALVQNAISGSAFARFIIDYSLFLSSAFDNLWVTRIIGQI
ncbi:CvpA family protein [Enterococcus sp. AZ109]|uniref:CvpA family protein n=1 Tax=Enterococcus sp. AZ109 TaxID=2774634 RepID=UPI003F20BD96